MSSFAFLATLAVGLIAAVFLCGWLITKMSGTVRTILMVVLACCAVGLVYLIYDSVMEPVRFNRRKEAREQVAIQRLKDIRDLETAYKGVYGKFTASVDTLKAFYANGQVDIVKQVGSRDDSVAVANTQAFNRTHRKATIEEMEAYTKATGKQLVYSKTVKVPVKEILFTDRPDFVVDSLAFIPFSKGDSIEYKALVKTVSGVQVPLFEASMPYKKLLKGLDNQLRINLDADKKDQGRYPGLQVGSVTAPNNNAGNWE